MSVGDIAVMLRCNKSAAGPHAERLQRPWTKWRQSSTAKRPWIISRPSARLAGRGDLPMRALPFALLLLALPAPLRGQPEPIEIRFCPAAVARSYPLDLLRGVQSLHLQNVAALNRAGGTVELREIEIALLQRRRGARRAADRWAIAGGGAARRPGAAGAGHDRAARLPILRRPAARRRAARRRPGARAGPGGAAHAAGLRLARPARRSAGDGDRPRSPAARSARNEASASIRRPRPPASAGRCGGGPWLVGAGASFHTTHRWAMPEEFALDIFAVGADGRSHRGDGGANRDFLAYDAEVVAAADGIVARLVTGASEAPPMLRAPARRSALIMRASPSGRRPISRPARRG